MARKLAPQVRDLLPQLATAERRSACGQIATLIANANEPRLPALEPALIPLVELAPSVPEARRALATAARSLTFERAYQEALACLLAVRDADDTGIVGIYRAPMTREQERAYHAVWTYECELASRDEAIAARAVLDIDALTPVLGTFELSASIWEHGDVRDFQARARTRAANAMRMFATGSDPCSSRKPKKGAKQPADADAAGWLARARTYLDAALEYVAPRAAADFGGLAIGQWCMLDGAHAPLKRRVWQAETFAERAFLAEQTGDLDGARAPLAIAQFIFALDDPTSRDLDEVYKNAFARLGTSPTPP